MCVDTIERRCSRRSTAQRRVGRACLGVLVCMMGIGCTPNPHGAPHGYLPTVEEAAYSAYGCWVSVETRDSEVPLAGELISAHADSLYILTLWDMLVPVSTFDVDQVVVVTHYPKVEGLVGWTVLGTLSTASHGALLIISGPMWVLSGSISSASYAQSGSIGISPRSGPWDQKRNNSSEWNSLSDVGYTPNLHTRLSAYARFPFGLPPHLDRSVLRSKPYLPLRSSPAPNQWQIDHR